MTVQRSEPANSPELVDEQHGRPVATDALVKRARAAYEGAPVELDYEVNGVETSLVGEIAAIDQDGTARDLTVSFSNRSQTAYLHINKATRDMFFSAPTPAEHQAELLLFELKD